MILARTLIEGTAVTFPQNAGAQNCTDLLGGGWVGAGFFGGFCLSLCKGQAARTRVLGAPEQPGLGPGVSFRCDS